MNIVSTLALLSIGFSLGYLLQYSIRGIIDYKNMTNKLKYGDTDDLMTYIRSQIPPPPKTPMFELDNNFQSTQILTFKPSNKILVKTKKVKNKWNLTKIKAKKHGSK